MTGKFHLSRNNQLAPCEAATSESCPLGGMHYGKEEAAMMKDLTSSFKQSAPKVKKVNPKRVAYVKSIVPRESEDRAKYYAQTEAKHFGNPNTPGSKFTGKDVKTIDDVLLKAWEQRGSLEGDDRDKFIALGATPDAFLEGKRYLMVKTPGTVGIKKSEGLPDETMVEIVRTKTGAPCSVVLDVDKQEKTDYAVVVVTKDFLDPEKKKDLVITLFPGTPTAPVNNDVIDTFEGKKVPLGLVRSIVGDIWLNTRLKK